MWLANSAPSSGPDFPIRTPRTDRSEFSNFAAILAAFCYTKNLHVNPSFLSSKINENWISSLKTSVNNTGLLDRNVHGDTASVKNQYKYFLQSTFPERKNKHVICRPRSVRNGKNCALGPEHGPRPHKTSGTVFPNTDLPAGK